MPVHCCGGPIIFAKTRLLEGQHRHSKSWEIGDAPKAAANTVIADANSWRTRRKVSRGIVALNARAS